MLFTVWARATYFLSDFKLYIIALLVSFFLTIFLSLRISRSTLPEDKKKLLLLAVFTLLSLVLVYSGFEAYMRYKFDEPDSLGFLKITGKWFERHVVYNNYQYRDRDFVTEKTPGVTRIGVMGDSFAMGYGIKNVNDRFSNLLEQKLKKAGKKVEVYNIGQSGLDTLGENQQYDRVKHLNFDIVVWEYFLNDADTASRSAGGKILLREQRQGKFFQFLSSLSYFFDYIYWKMEARYEKTFQELRNSDMAAYRDEKNFVWHKKIVGNFINELKDDNKKIVVIVFPYIKFFPDYPAKDIHKLVHQMFKESGHPVDIDLLDDLRGKNSKDLIVSQYDFHPNEYVQKIAAQKLYEKILPLIQ